MLRKIVLAALLLNFGVAAAEARCVYGYKNLPGSLGPGQTDNSRSFTVDGYATFSVEVRTGGPITADLGCGWQTGYNLSCEVEAYREKFVHLQNNTGQQITYRWICSN